MIHHGRLEQINLYDLYGKQYIVNKRRIRWPGHIQRMTEGSEEGVPRYSWGKKIKRKVKENMNQGCGKGSSWEAEV